LKIALAIVAKIAYSWKPSNMSNALWREVTSNLVH